MRLAVFDDYRLGVVRDEMVFDVTGALEDRDTHWPPTFLLRAIASWSRLRAAVEQAAASSPGKPLSQVRLRPPVINPSKVVAAPVNYLLHHREMSGNLTIRELGVFLKAPSSLLEPGGYIELPYPDRRTDHEVELAVVVGSVARDIRTEEALGYVFGYTIACDVTVRGEEDRSTRKSFDTFTPLGPWVVTADEIPDPQDLRLRLWLNGELRQDASTKEMIYGVCQLLAYISSVMTLFPGDVISTGSPAGVSPLQAGDEVTMEIERIGRLDVHVRNRQSW